MIAAIVGADSKVRSSIELETLDQLLAKLDGAGYPLILSRLTDRDFAQNGSALTDSRVKALVALSLQPGDLRIMIYDEDIE